MDERIEPTAHYHLPGLFEFYEFYRVFLPLFYEHREWFYDWCDIGSIYGAPADCLWDGGRTGYGDDDPREVLSLLREYGISARLTFSNSLLREEHLSDKKCTGLCALFNERETPRNGVIVHSELLLAYLRRRYPKLYFVSSTTKVLTDFRDFRKELEREEFSYVVPDFRLNRRFDRLGTLPQAEKDKVEFLCNECCDFGCAERRACYEAVSRQNLGEDAPEHRCAAPDGAQGLPVFQSHEKSRLHRRGGHSGYISSHGLFPFQDRGRTLGSAVLLEFLLHYLTRPKYHLPVREEIYLDGMLDLFKKSGERGVRRGIDRAAFMNFYNEKKSV